MTDQEKCTKLAEFVDRMPRDSKSGEVIPWQDVPDAKELMLAVIPDPLHDANHCNALITHLNELGYVVRIDIHATESMVMLGHINKSLQHKWVTVDNWMHGVCELALKIIDS